MKKVLSIFILFACAYSSFSQDLIVTTDADSLNCRITKVKSDFIYFTLKYKGENKNTLIARSDVSDIRYGFFAIEKTTESKHKFTGNYDPLRISISGGYSYQTAKIADNVPTDFLPYMKKLKSGSNIGGDITYFISESVGFGFRLSQFKTSNSADIYVTGPDGSRTYGEMSDNIRINYWGPTLTSRTYNRLQNNAFYSTLSLGYISYLDDYIMIDNYSIKGHTIGYLLEIGYDIDLSNKVALGFQLSFYAGNLFNINISDGNTITEVQFEAGEYESVSRIDFTVGIRFHE
ncbi:hypothetical protein ACE1ET_07710 [Saccharicrinis sp. FJH62]|uniref:hypothetical protein n=1 Tax=Saccharicrinis sp. FJH62 TaxID=3344657 RepID=UPI0035D424A4